MKKHHKFLLYGAIIIVAFISYLFVNPVYFKLGRILSPRRL